MFEFLIDWLIDSFHACWLEKHRPLAVELAVFQSSEKKIENIKT